MGQTGQVTSTLCSEKSFSNIAIHAWRKIAHFAHKATGQKEELIDTALGTAEKPMVMQEIHSEISRSGVRPSELRPGGNRFSFSSAVCHLGGDNPAGCWATEQGGQLRLHCHKCPFLTTEQQIRQNCGLPAWSGKGETGFLPGKSRQETERGSSSRYRSSRLKKSLVPGGEV